MIFELLVVYFEMCGSLGSIMAFKIFNVYFESIGDMRALFGVKYDCGCVWIELFYKKIQIM